MPQPCINCAADAEIPNTFKLPGETDDQWIDRITGAQAAPAAVAERGVEGTGLTEAEFAQYVQQRKDFNAAPAAAQPVSHANPAPARFANGGAGLQSQQAAQPVAGEPQGWRVDWPGDGGQSWHQVFINEGDALERKRKHPGSVCSPLYTTPPALVGLSDEQIELLESATFAAIPERYWTPLLDFARAIERALVAANGMTLQEPSNG